MGHDFDRWNGFSFSFDFWALEVGRMYKTGVTRRWETSYPWCISDPSCCNVNLCQNVDTKGCNFFLHALNVTFPVCNKHEQNKIEKKKKRMGKSARLHIRHLKTERSPNLIRTSFRAGSENMCIVLWNVHLDKNNQRKRFLSFLTV
jgi:hypothetical protein